MGRDLVRVLAPHLQLLAALGEVEHVTKAADLLGVPQPTVSRTLRALEHRLGFPVTERAGRGIQLTTTMRSFIPYANRALSELQDGAALLESNGDRCRSTVRLAFQTSLGEELVPRMIRLARRQAPTLQFTLHQGSRSLCINLLESGKAQIALVSDPGQIPQGFISQHLLRQQLVALVPDGHRLSDSEAIDVEALAGEPIVTLRTGHGLRDAVEDLFRRHGRSPVISFEGEDIPTVRGLIAAGLGIAVVPAVPVVLAGCVQIPITSEWAWRQIGAAVRVGSQSEEIALVLDTLVEAASSY